MFDGSTLACSNIRHFLWGTDFHLTHRDEATVEQFSTTLREQIQAQDIKLLAFSGDLGWQGTKRVPYLLLDTELVGLETKVLCVRGNHDLQESDVIDSNEYIRTSDRFIDIHRKIIPLSEFACMIGENGAPDFRAAGEDIRSNATSRNTTPQAFPEAFQGRPDGWPNMYGVAWLLRAKADESTDFLVSMAREAFKTFDKVYLLTHYPPFVDACLYQGQSVWAPHCGGIVNARLGKELVTLMSDPAFSAKHLEVLCGHTHAAHTYQPLSNLLVRVGQELSVAMLQV